MIAILSHETQWWRHDIIVNVFLMGGGEGVGHWGNGPHEMVDQPRCPEETGQLLLGTSV